MMSTTGSQLVTTWRLAAPRRFAEPGVSGRPTTTFAVASAPFVEKFPTGAIRTLCLLRRPSLHLLHLFSVLGRIRTSNLLIRSQIGLSAVLTWEIAGWGERTDPS